MSQLPTIDALQQGIDAQQWLFLSGAEKGEEALKRAGLWLTGEQKQFDPQGGIDWSDDLMRQAALERAAYELYKMAGVASAGAAHKKDAQSLVWDYYGYDPDAEDGVREKAVAASVRPGPRPAVLDGFAGRY